MIASVNLLGSCMSHGIFLRADGTFEDMRDFQRNVHGMICARISVEERHDVFPLTTVSDLRLRIEDVLENVGNLVNDRIFPEIFLSNVESIQDDLSLIEIRETCRGGFQLLPGQFNVRDEMGEFRENLSGLIQGVDDDLLRSKMDVEGNQGIQHATNGTSREKEVNTFCGELF